MVKPQVSSHLVKIFAFMLFVDKGIASNPSTVMIYRVLYVVHTSDYCMVFPSRISLHPDYCSRECYCTYLFGYTEQSIA